jgi:hypothetical protein
MRLVLVLAERDHFLALGNQKPMFAEVIKVANQFVVYRCDLIL